MDEHVGKNVEMQRKRLGLEAQYVAEKMQLSPELYEAYEAGRDRIGSALLLKLAEILDVDPSVFFENITMDTAAKLNIVRQTSK